MKVLFDILISLICQTTTAESTSGKYADQEIKLCVGKCSPEERTRGKKFAGQTPRYAIKMEKGESVIEREV